MALDIAESWEQFRQVLAVYCETHLVLNPPCSTEQIHEVETRLSFELPSSLKVLLSMNDGQRVNSNGVKKAIFKSVSGWDVYERHIFLGIRDIETAYRTFIDDSVLRSEFGVNEIPFAVAGSPTRYREAFCLNRSIGVVSLIWTEYTDPFNPAKWQVDKFTRSQSLAEFIQKQIEFYR
ncbi:SMI1/KNR4 family protein [Trichothermofontia sichuanensis B231]|uniref:SMI1/KNR4 family protein n=1 Tax=Trichothermofontia sichuanensis TaxID=3045816 RepID=UPI002246F636|nr:SMI1/KNR4 family protein [Trichothermofontia sichuanensis]UZQ54117.1 SMI1/KNR4 family protein [Trichothermofontia sichuanensis B231]